MFFWISSLIIKNINVSAIDKIFICFIFILLFLGTEHLEFNICISLIVSSTETDWTHNCLRIWYVLIKTLMGHINDLVLQFCNLKPNVCSQVMELCNFFLTFIFSSSEAPRCYSSPTPCQAYWRGCQYLTNMCADSLTLMLMSYLNFFPHGFIDQPFPLHFKGFIHRNLFFIVISYNYIKKQNLYNIQTFLILCDYLW